MWILVRGSDEIIRRPHNGVRTKPGTVLQHHLETTGTAEALYRRRRNGQHTRILDHGKTLTQVGQYCVRVYAGNFMVVERGQAGKIVAEFDATVDVVASRPAKGATCSTPRVVRMISVACFTTSSVRASVAPGGS